VCIHLIDQGSPENNIIIGVRQEHHEKSVRAIYNEFANVTGDEYDEFEVGTELMETAV